MVLKRSGCSEQSREVEVTRDFAMIAKISLGLRKFRNPSEIFAMREFR